MTNREIRDAYGRIQPDDAARERMLRHILSSAAAADWQEAFRAAHTIKGVCQNLGFSRLYESSSELSEAMRDGKPLADPALLERVKEDYAATAGAIRALQEALGV